MSNDDRGLAPPWPDASLRPADDAPPIEWARFFRDHCGWIVYPCAGPADVRSYAESLALKAAAEYAVDHTGSASGDIPDEVSTAFWDDAREIAEATLGRPIGHIYNAWSKKVAVASDVTDEMLRLAWEPLEHSRGPRAEADKRGIAIMPGRSSKGLPVVLVDVDPDSGGDIEGPWGMQLPGPKASTPGRGDHVPGLHTLMLSTGKESAGPLAPGVDVVASGGTMIPVPSGSATPGRVWLRWEAPAPAPEALRRRGRKKTPPRPGEASETTGASGGAGTPAGDSGPASEMMLSPVGDGERNHVAGAIVGMLARPRACPEDFVVACLETLAEYHAANLTHRDEAVAEQTRWRHLLTRGPRDREFATDVLEVWYEVRNTASKRWKTTPRKFAASMWRVCDRREEGNAGAEDFGVGPALAIAAEVLGSGPPPPPTTPTAMGDAEGSRAPAPDDPVPYPPPAPEVAQSAVQASKVEAPRWRGGVDPRTYTKTLGEFYTDADLERDLTREPIQIAEVMPVVDFVTGLPQQKGVDIMATPLSMGWGDALNRAIGGLAASDFVVIGAAGAGAGKTWFECWLAHGLALQTAARILGVRGFERAPVVLPVWVTEMPKRGELYHRLAGPYLGFDAACLAAGTMAHNAPGVAAMAKSHSMTDHEVVARAREQERLHGADPRFPLAVARHQVIRTLRLSDLPRKERKSGIVVDHRSGPMLVDHLADAVDMYRDDLARLAGVTTDEVLPLVVIDPGQRFTENADTSEKRAIDALFGAVVAVLCNEVGAAVIATSDTTKDAAKNIPIDVFLGEDATALAARVLAGSYAITHDASCCILLQAERPADGGLTATQWARVVKSRSTGASSVAYPFTWEQHLGRFRPRDPEPLRKMPAMDGDGGRRRQSAPATPLASGAPGLSAAPWRGHERERYPD